MHVLKFICVIAISLGMPLITSASDAVKNTESQVAPAAELVAGEVRKVDKEAAKVTIRHGPLPNFGMPAMMMVFRVADPATRCLITRSMRRRSEILASISGSMSDTQPVFDAIVRNLKRLLGAHFAVVQVVRQLASELFTLCVQARRQELYHQQALPHCQRILQSQQQLLPRRQLFHRNCLRCKFHNKPLKFAEIRFGYRSI